MCDLMEMGVMFTRVNISLSHATQPLYQGHLQYFSELIKNYFQNLVLKLQFEESLFSMELLKKGWLYVSIYLSETVSIYLSAIGCFRCERNFNTIDLAMVCRRVGFVEAAESLKAFLSNAGRGGGSPEGLSGRSTR